MNHSGGDKNRRVLVIDDNHAIHDDFRKILETAAGDPAAGFDEARAALLGERPPATGTTGFEVDSAYQGQEAFELVREAIQEERPYALAFVDVRMPPGWDGIETISHLWEEDPDLQVVICTAHSDYSWDEMVDKLGQSDRLLILKKPFDNVEVCQFACALTEKWDLAKKAKLKLREIERIVEARTREIAQARDGLRDINKELAIAREAAEAASRSKSAFLANMSHEIRTPMTAILGFADVLIEHGDLKAAPPERIEAAETIKSNGEYLLGLIDDILDLSKIEAGKSTVEQLTCSLCRIVAEVESLMRVRSNAKGLRFDVEYEGAIPETIQTDPTRLRQILINVLGNAVKFTEVGRVRLITRFVDVDGGEPTVEFDVADTGLGMTEEQVAGLFQPFTQADASTTRQFGGTGLGLTISKRLAERLGGNLRVVETKPGVGTRFRVTVHTGPLDGVKMLDDPRSATVFASEATTKPSGPAPTGRLDCRILLAEDGPDNQRLIAHVLKKAGAHVTVVENGKLAVDAALAACDEGAAFDVILMDMQMPVMDGYEATGLLRQKGYAEPIIALTAHAMAGDREKCVQAGCDDYATKPVDRGALIRQVARWARDGAEARPQRVST